MWIFRPNLLADIIIFCNATNLTLHTADNTLILNNIHKFIYFINLNKDKKIVPHYNPVMFNLLEYLMKKLLYLIAIFFIGKTYAVNTNLSPNTITNSSESDIILTKEEIRALKKLAEQQKIESYSGDLGTAPIDKTISSTGAALEETPSGPQVFAFFSQTLANGLYYEGRLYTKYNMQSQNPAFPDVPASSENNPEGYKAVFKLGYNFHITDDYDITPYLRLEAGKNMSLVYADTEGNYINSTNYAILPGFKQTFKLSDKFAPYIDIYGGLSQVSLTGNLTEGPTPNQTMDGSVQQYQLTTELGFAYKITPHQAIIPYMQFVYNSNNPDTIAAEPYSKGGFNISELSSSQQVYAIKYSYSW